MCPFSHTANETKRHQLIGAPKLDRVLISSSWEVEFPLCNLRKIPRYMSDHNPLFVRTDLYQQIGSRPFCFENSWLQHADFSRKIKEIWKKNLSQVCH